MKEWVRVDNELPELGKFVITSVRNGNHIYHEILKLDEDSRKWMTYHDVELGENIEVIGWTDLPSILIN